MTPRVLRGQGPSHCAHPVAVDSSSAASGGCCGRAEDPAVARAGRGHGRDPSGHCADRVRPIAPARSP
eukprot:9676626-Alexandrium_andersonii.AAC.1